MNPNDYGSANAAGSPQGSGPFAGQPQGDYVPKTMYDELYTKMGQMGNENGEYRKFFDDISPLFEKLDEHPEIAQAITDEKFDSAMAEAILEGRISIKDAEDIEEAYADVEQELGKKGLKSTSADDLAKMVEQKLSAFKDEQAQRDELKSFESRTNEFIATTADFSDYADHVSAWLDEHKDITDVETAYYAVKGKMSVGQAAALAEQAQAEAAKEYALNASGGNGSATFIPKEDNLIDRLISNRSNPNMF